MSQGLREDRRAIVGKAVGDLMVISLLPSLDGRKTDPKAEILITPADLAARVVVSVAVECVSGSVEVGKVVGSIRGGGIFSSG